MLSSATWRYGSLLAMAASDRDTGFPKRMSVLTLSRKDRFQGSPDHPSSTRLLRRQTSGCGYRAGKGQRPPRQLGRFVPRDPSTGVGPWPPPSKLYSRPCDKNQGKGCGGIIEQLAPKCIRRHDAPKAAAAVAPILRALHSVPLTANANHARMA